ncbi:MAG: RagB/SusD family nutrient uptake outer membrane protein, partial [Bacteroidota bacterium]|nr:RagB/SusD family nutrient uptake outer membrane protein [Bacteroidota bacterium]
MKKIQYILIILTLTIGLVGCTKLDEEVYDKIPENNFPENDSQAALNVVPTYQALAPLIDDAGWWFWAQEVTSDEIVFPVRLTDWDDGGKWRVLHQHAWDNNTNAVNSMWSHLYDGVFEANKAIDLLPESSDDAALALKAKLIAMRTFYYYLLIDNYGDVPYVTSYLDAPEQPTKELRATIFNSIVAELEQNTQYLPVSGNNFSVTKGMAFTLLAKLYLNAEVYTGIPDWEKAGVYCDSVMNLNYLLQSNPLDPFLADNAASPENIFTIPFDESDLKGLRIHMRTLHYLSSQTYNMVAGPWNGFAAVEDHYKTFESNDLRKEGFLVGPQFSSTGEALFDETAEADLNFDPHIPA